MIDAVDRSEQLRFALERLRAFTNQRGRGAERPKSRNNARSIRPFSSPSLTNVDLHRLNGHSEENARTNRTESEVS
jgi:hypothetical protein